MNTCIILTEDPIYTPDIVKQLICYDELKIKLVIIPSGFISLKRIYSTFFIYGIKKFTLTVFKVLINIFKGGVIQTLFKDAGIKVLKVKNINSNKVHEKLKLLDLDIIISNNCPQKLNKKILLIPKMGAINVHLGLLPKYRGLFPLFHAFIRNEEEVGVSIHFMNTKFDDGDILCQKKIFITEEDDLFSLYNKSFELVPELILKSIKIITGKLKLETIKNNISNSSYFSFPNFNEIRIYKNKIMKLK